jgi:hypothetical protein
VNGRIGKNIEQHRDTPNSSISPLMLARNSSSSVGWGIAGGCDSNSGSRPSWSTSTREKEETVDSAESRDPFTSSEFNMEHSNVDLPREEDGASKDSIVLVTISPSVILGELFEVTPLMA